MIKKVAQFDKAILKGSTVETDEGFLVCDAVVTRPGVFTYLVNGQAHKRYCPPEVVHDARSYATLIGKPLVSGHPYTEDGKLITPKNAARLSKGSVLENVRQHDSDIMAKFVVMDAGAIAQIKDKTLPELSCGYIADIDFTPGVTPEGVHYDSKQTSRIYNHLSLEKSGRVGNAKIVLDAIEYDGVELDFIDEEIQTTEAKMGKKIIVLDSVSYEMDEDAVPVVKGLQAEKDKSAKEVITLTAQLDAKESEISTLKKDLESAKAMQLDEAEINKRADERAKVLVSATLHLDAKEIEGKSSSELKGALCKKAFPDVQLDGKSADYVQALYDQSVVMLEKKAAPVKQTVRALPELDANEINPVTDARQRMIDRLEGKEVKK